MPYVTSSAMTTLENVLAAVQGTTACSHQQGQGSQAYELLEIVAMETEEDGIALQKTWAIITPGQRWLPEIKEMNGIPFMKITKFDRSLTKWTLGTSMDMRQGKGKSLNVRGFDDWVKLRKQASQAAVNDVLLQSAKQDPEEETKATKKRHVKEDDKDLLPNPWIMVNLPKVTRKEKEHGPLTVKCLYAVQSPDIWVEFSENVLLWFKAMVLSDRDGGNTGKTRKRNPKKTSLSLSPKRRLLQKLPSPSKRKSSEQESI